MLTNHRRTRMPAVLVEVGFINSETDNQLFDNNFNDIALAIAEGILDTLQMNDNAPSAPVSYTVQAGAFRNGAYADRLQQELLEQDFPAVTSQENGLYRVTVGTYPALDEAAAMERRLKQAGYQTVIVRS